MKKLRLRKEVKLAILGVLVGTLTVVGIFNLIEYRYKTICESGNTYYCASTWE